VLGTMRFEQKYTRLLRVYEQLAHEKRLSSRPEDQRADRGEQ
jgi:hypothetical protein